MGRSGGTHGPPESQLRKPDLPKKTCHLWYEAEMAWAASDPRASPERWVGPWWEGLEGVKSLASHQEWVGNSMWASVRDSGRLHERFPDLMTGNSRVTNPQTSDSVGDLPNLSMVPDKQVLEFSQPLLFPP